MSELARVTKGAETPKHKSFLFWGGPGTGKTTLALQHPGKNKIIIDIDQKMGEMENLSKQVLDSVTVWQPGVPLRGDEIDMIQVDQTGKNVTAHFDSSRKTPEGFTKQRNVTNELLALKKEGTFPYDLAIWDSMTRTSDHLVQLVMWQHKVTSMTERLWGVVGTNLLNYVLGFLQLPCDRIVIAHEQHKKMYDKDRETVIQEFIRPLVTGQMAQYLPQHFSEVYYFLGRSASDKKYYIQTAADRLKCARTTKKLEFDQAIDSKLIFGS